MAQGIGQGQHQEQDPNQAAEPFGHLDVQGREHHLRQHEQA